MVDYFKSTLNPKLTFKLETMDSPPQTIKEWYDKVIITDSHYRKAKMAVKQGRTGNPTQEKKKWVFKKKNKEPDTHPQEIQTPWT